MCLMPVTLWRSYATIDGRKTDVVPCGKCPQCLQRRANHWTFRLKEELKHSTSGTFLTLTYENAPVSPNGLPTLVKRDFQLFMKRLRKHLKKSSLKYYMCGEYGDLTARPHYHAIMFNIPHKLLQNHDKLQSLWEHGIVDVAKCEIASIAYVTGYVNKGRFQRLPDLVNEDTGEILEDDRQPHFSMMSKKLGLSFITPAMYNYLIKTMTGCVVEEGGKIQSLPRYFKDKIFSRRERKLIAAEYQRIRELSYGELTGRQELDNVKNQLRKYDKLTKLKRLKL
jgi:hypothetical protein